MSINFTNPGNTNYLSRSVMPINAPPFTISCWWKMDAMPAVGQFNVPFQLQNASGTVFVEVYIHNISGVGNRFCLASNSGGELRTGAFHWYTNVWYHVLLKVAGTTGSLYVNNYDLYDGSVGALSSLSTLVIGSDNYVTDSCQGSIAQFGIWNAILAASDITSLSQGVSPATIQTGSLVDCFPLSDLSGADTKYATPLTVHGSPTVAADPAPTYSAFTQWPIVLQDDFVDASHIDVNNSQADGFLWYPQMFFNYPPNPQSYYSVANSILTINNATNTWNDTLHTCVPANNPVGYRGTAFAGGEGIYFEAKIAFDNISSISGSGWPSFWLDSLKREANVNNRMLGVSQLTPDGHPYTEAMEMDIMEYNPTWTSWNGEYHFGLIEWIPWSGPGGHIGDGKYVFLPNDDPLVYHTYGMLWMPPTAANGWIGSQVSYFDGCPWASFSWQGNQVYSQVLPPTWDSIHVNNYLFSGSDRDYMMMILGASTGGTATMHVDYIKVYAANPTLSVRKVTNTQSTWSCCDGLQDNVQSFCNSAASGDTVMIPLGTYNWNTDLTITKPITVEGQAYNTILVNSKTSPATITGINFSGKWDTPPPSVKITSS